MFSTGFKFWFTAALFGLAAAFVLAVSTSDAGLMDTVLGPLSLGYKGAVGDHGAFAALVGFAGVSLATALLLVAWRDADPTAVAEFARVEEPPTPAVPQGPSRWPALAAFAGALIALGVVVDPAFTVIGIALVIVAGMEWTIGAWSERATIDPELNRSLRTKLFFPIELPIVAAVVIAVFVLAGSRILLAVSAESSTIIAGVLAGVIFLVAIAIAAKPDLSRGLVNAVLVVGAIGLLAGGIVAAASGEREFHEHGEEHGEEPVGEEHGDEPAADESGDLPAEPAAEDHGGEALVVLP